jgi:hypothetical protein
MRFKTGFFLGCAAGAWAAAKASQLKRVDNARADWPRVASSRAENVSAEVSAERLRTLSGLARERLSGFLESPLGGIARDRLTAIVGSSLGRDGRDSATEERRRPA